MESAMKNNETQDFGVAIDHLLIATPELELGCKYIFEQFGVEPIIGGSHPGKGTRNALLGLEDDIYIEILAPDPHQAADLPLGQYLRGLEQTTLMWWAARCRDFDALAGRLQQHDVEILSRGPWSRRLPDGRELEWELLIPGASAFQAALPFFIHWGEMTQHPSRNLPVCGALNSLHISHPANEELRQILGPCYQTGHEPGKKLQAELTIGGKSIHLATPDEFPPGVGEIR